MTMQPYYEAGGITLYHGDCLDVMAQLDAGAFDAVICDPPYGTTACAWDSVIPFVPMWAQLRRLGKARAAHVLFGSQPFTSALIASNFDMYKYSWVWDKAQSGSFLSAKYQPLRVTEDIAVFSKDTATYYPEMRQGAYRKRGGAKTDLQTAGSHNRGYIAYSDEYFPTNLLRFPNCANRADNLHPTQKPLALMEYLIKTYTNEGDLILDFTAGSGTTLRAAKNLRRRCVGIERDRHYCEVTVKRLEPAFETALIDNGATLEDLPMFAPLFESEDV